MARPAEPRHWAEAVARRYLEGLGWNVVAHNVVSRGAELDLVAWDGPTLVVVEVRQRRNARFGHPAETLDARKLARLRLGGARYLQRARLPADTPWRIDAVLVLGTAERHRWWHLKAIG